MTKKQFDRLTNNVKRHQRPQNARTASKNEKIGSDTTQKKLKEMETRIDYIMARLIKIELWIKSVDKKNLADKI